MFYICSKGSSCPQCNNLKDCINNKKFTNYMKSNKLLWCYVVTSDKGASSFPLEFARGMGGNSGYQGSLKKKLSTYRSKEIADLGTFPFCGLYWYNPYLKKQIYDVVAMGSDLRNGG